MKRTVIIAALFFINMLLLGTMHLSFVASQEDTGSGDSVDEIIQRITDDNVPLFERISNNFEFLQGSVIRDEEQLRFAQGDTCEPNRAECPDGFTLFIDAIQNGNINMPGVDQAVLLNAVKRDLAPDPPDYITYSSTQIDIYNLCIHLEGGDRGRNGETRTANVPSVIPIVFAWDATGLRNIFGGDDLGGFEAYSAQGLEEGGRFGFGNVNFTGFQACWPGTSPSRGMNSFQGLDDRLIDAAGNVIPIPGFGSGNTPYGCCPSGFAFVNRTSARQPWESQLGACCRGSSSNFTHYDEGQGCMNGDTVVHSENSDVIRPQGGASAIQSIVDQANAGQGNIILDGYTENVPFHFGHPIGEKAISDDMRSGENAIKFVYAAGQRDTDANVLCSDIYENGCVLDATGNVIKTSTLENNPDTTTCKRCYLPGEVVGLNIDSTGILVCDPEQPNNVDEQALINNNVQDTIAYLRADSTNQPLLEGCREQGGIYTAIGCIDPTPIGIITGIIRITLGVIGGVALIQLILAGIAYQSGQEERIQEAQKMLLATFGGLVLLIFSIVILRIIGVNVLDVVPEGLF